MVEHTFTRGCPKRLGEPMESFVREKEENVIEYGGKGVERV
jgi:hypothetical protein